MPGALFCQVDRRFLGSLLALVPLELVSVGEGRLLDGGCFLGLLVWLLLLFLGTFEPLGRFLLEELKLPVPRCLALGSTLCSLGLAPLEIELLEPELLLVVLVVSEFFEILRLCFSLVSLILLPDHRLFTKVGRRFHLFRLSGSLFLVVWLSELSSFFAFFVF